MTPVDELDVTPASYGALLADVKAAVAAARTRATRAVNTELVALYWQIGRLILDRQHAEGWGTRVIDRLSIDLRAEFPGMRGFSARSLKYMRRFAAEYPNPIVQQPVAQLPWRHITTLLDTVPGPTARDWYAAQDVEYGWSTAVLAHHISTDRHARVGAAPSTFPQTLTRAESDQTRELLQDPYVLDFLALDPHHSERDLEDAIVTRLTRFLTELGTGFAFVGRQYRLAVGRSEYFCDLLFYNLRLRRFVVFELKTGSVQPEHLGKLNFYVNVIDNQLRDRDHGDQPTIGILLAADRDDVAVEYALQGLTTPLAVSTYRALPDDVRPALPSAADLQQLVRNAQQDLGDQPESD
jgi:predicted nuclease of restriction endonuclease-like (RecB) superfamily